MKIYITILCCMYLVSGCSTDQINGDVVNVDTLSVPAIYTYKKSGEKVTGIVTFYALDPNKGERYKERLREVKDGIKINFGYNFYPNGQIRAKFPYVNGSANGITYTYYENGSINGEIAMKDDQYNGLSKVYDENGSLIQEIIFKNGVVDKEFDISITGKRIDLKEEKVPKTQVKNSSKTGYQYLLNDDEYYPFNFTRHFTQSDSTFITSYHIFDPDEGKHVYTITATHNKVTKHISVDVSDTKQSIFSHINTEVTDYEVPSDEPFGFRGNIGLLGGKSVPNQLFLKFHNNSYEHVEVLHVYGTAPATNNFTFYVLDGQRR